MHRRGERTEAGEATGTKPPRAPGTQESKITVRGGPIKDPEGVGMQENTVQGTLFLSLFLSLFPLPFSLLLSLSHYHSHSHSHSHSHTHTHTHTLSLSHSLSFLLSLSLPIIRWARNSVDRCWHGNCKIEFLGTKQSSLKTRQPSNSDDQSGASQQSGFPLA